MSKDSFKILIVLYSLLLLCSLFWHGRIMAANRRLNLAERNLRISLFPEAFNWYEKSLEIGGHTLNPYTRYRYGQGAKSYVRVSRFLDKDISEDYLERAVELQEENMDKEWTLFTRNYVVKGQLLTFLSEKERARESFEKALEMSPNRPNLYLDLSRAVPSESEEMIGESMEMNPNNPKSYWELMLLRVRQGREEEAGELFSKVIGFNYNIFQFEPLSRLAEAYEEAGKDEMAHHYRELWLSITNTN